MVGAVLALVMLVTACTPEGPPPSTWRVKANSVQVVRQNNYSAAGDRPYTIQIGFRSKLGVANSSRVDVVSQCYNGKLPAPDAAPDGQTHTFPDGAADVVFPNTQNLDVGDLMLNTAPLEIFGVMTFAMNRNVHEWFNSCAMSDALGALLAPALRDALNMLIANSSTPPTQEALINLIIANLGNFMQGLGSFLMAQIEGLGNPDAIVGVGVNILVPTSGAFTGLLSTGLTVADWLLPEIDSGFVNLPALPPTLKVRIGPMAPSWWTYDFDGDAGHYRVNMSVTG
ncbi:MAG: hypothetical protein GX868_02445 [Actinobacteria bacterium]|nr:hypothetical protein [Actinomycetota bacterium]